MTVIGIDLGTTTCCVAAIINGKPEVIPDMGGRKTIPSVVSFVPRGGSVDKICGYPAAEQMLMNTENTVYCVKRLMGLPFDSPVVNQLIPMLSYKIQRSKENNGVEVTIPVAGKSYTPEELSSYLLAEIRAQAEKYLGESVTKAVITVPAYFNNRQRQATRDAALIAGLEVLRIINEPTAAAIAYGILQEEGANEKRLAVFDFGGGTFDVTIMDVGHGAFNVIATAGNTFLGGEDITNVLFEHLVNQLTSTCELAESAMGTIIQRLHDYAESAKKSLTLQESVDIDIPYLEDAKGEYVSFKSTVTRELLDELAMPFVKRSIQTFARVLEEIEMPVDGLDGIIMIGGQTRMLLIQKEINAFAKHVPILKNVNPDETVALGAAIQATNLDDENEQDHVEMILLDVTPHNLGIAVGGDMFYTLIEKNSKVPISVDDVFVTSRDYQDRAKIVLLQGDSKVASENEILGEFEFLNLRPAPRGEVKINISYEIDINGIVTVEATDVETGRKQNITVSSSSNLSEDDLAQKIAENSDYYLELAEKSIIEDVVQNIERELFELETMKREAHGFFESIDGGKERIAKLESLIDTTNAYLRSEKLNLNTLQDFETKLMTIREAYGKLILASYQ